MRPPSQSAYTESCSSASSTSPILPETEDVHMTSVLSAKNQPRSSSFRIPTLSPSGSFNMQPHNMTPSTYNHSLSDDSLAEETEDDDGHPLLRLNVSEGIQHPPKHSLLSPSASQLYCEPPTPSIGDLSLHSNSSTSQTDRPVPFFVCVCGIVVFYGGYSVLQEMIFSDADFQYGVFVSTVQLFIYVLVCLSQPYLIAPIHYWWNSGYQMNTTINTSLIRRNISTQPLPALPLQSSVSTSTLKKRRTDSVDTENVLENIGDNPEHIHMVPSNLDVSNIPRTISPRTVSPIASLPSSTISNSSNTTPLYYFAILGGLSVVNVLISNISLQFLSYPLKVMLKACKLLPVVIIGSSYFKRKYTIFEWLAVLLLTSGVLVCSMYKPEQMNQIQMVNPELHTNVNHNLNQELQDMVNSNSLAYKDVPPQEYIPNTKDMTKDNKIVTESNNIMKEDTTEIPIDKDNNTFVDKHIDIMLMIGVSMMVVSMLSDAAVTNIQERVLERFNPSINTLVLQSKYFALAAASLILLLSGTFFDACAYCYDHPRMLLNIILFGILGCSGEFFVMEVIRQYGSLVAVCVTSLRKLMNVLLSFVILPKKVHPGFFLGMSLVFIGMMLEAYAKNRKKQEKRIASLPSHHHQENHNK